MNAGVADHPGMLFSQDPVPSDDFEASFVVDLRPSDIHNDGFVYEGLAFWYIHDDPKELRRINNEHEKKRRLPKVKGQRFGLFGYKNNYNGLGAFIFFDAGSPMMTAIHNSGKKSVSRHDVFGAITGLGLYDVIYGEEELHDPVADDPEQIQDSGTDRNDKGVSQIKVKLRVDATSANVTVVGTGTLQFDLDGQHPGRGGYLGVTALSYAARRDPELKPIGIELKDLKVVSFTDVGEKVQGRNLGGGDSGHFEGGHFEQEEL